MDHVTLKTGVMAFENSALKFENLKYIKIEKVFFLSCNIISKYCFFTV